MLKLTKDKLPELLYPFLVMLTAAVYAGILCSRTAPFTEGWYTYYSQCIHSGAAVYKDFEYLYTPAYIYLIALITRIFGYKIIVLRILGIGVFSVLALSLYLVASEIFPRWISCISAVTAALFLQSEVVQTFYDYARVMDIFSVLTTLLLLKTVKRWESNDKKLYIYISATAILNSFFALIKQNMGCIYVVYVLCLLVFLSVYYRLSIKTALKRIGLYIGAFMIPVGVCLIWLLANGSLSIFWQSIFTNAVAAKGALPAILFGWIINNFNSFKACFTESMILLALILILSLRAEKSPKEHREHPYPAYIFALAASAVFFICSVSEKTADLISAKSYPSPYLIFLVIFPIFVMLGISCIRDWFYKKYKYQKYIGIFALSGVYFAISYGSGNSGGLPEGQAPLGVILIIGLLLSNIVSEFAGGGIGQKRNYYHLFSDYCTMR